MEIAPLCRLGYNRGGVIFAPPYDVITPAEHKAWLEAEPYNITRLTLGSTPGEASSYEERAALLRRWIEEGVLVQAATPSFYVYTIDYAIPGAGAEGSLARFLGLVALGRLHEFSEGVVRPHEQTFPKVVEDRYRLLEATRAHLESILLLYADQEQAIDGILAEHAGGRNGKAVSSFGAANGDLHYLYRIDEPAVIRRLKDLFRPQRPVIADGHHRYTTALRYRREAGAAVLGSEWQLMTFANVWSDGVSILPTHRLVKLRQAKAANVLLRLASRLEMVQDDGKPPWELAVETCEGRHFFRFPPSLRAGKSAAKRTSYALLHDVVLGDWLRDEVDPACIRYFKEGTGEREALARGEGDLLFRLPPVARKEFLEVVEAGEVLPHKTTYFYPKLWSGLVLWSLQEP